MNNGIILTFKDGRKVDAALIGALLPQENSVEVFLYDGTGQHSISYDEICSIGLMGTPDVEDDEWAEEFLAEVETANGERHTVHVRTDLENHNGFYGTPVDMDTPCKSFFFVSDSVKVLSKQPVPGRDMEHSSHLPLIELQELLDEQSESKAAQKGQIFTKTNIRPQGFIDKSHQVKSGISADQQNARVGDILVSEGLVTREAVEQALKSREKKKIGTLLIERGFISEDQLLIALATKFRIRCVDLVQLIPDPKALGKLTKSIVNQMQVMPIELKGKKLVVATSEPTDSTIHDRLCFITNCNIELVAAFAHDISDAINRFYNMPIESMDDLINEMEGGQPTVVEQTEDEKYIEPDSKVIRLVNKILMDAHQKGASDVHFEPGVKNDNFIVRYRVDGECFISHQIPNTYKSAIISRLKIIGKLDIAERRRPQSGKIVLMYENHTLEYRLEITPTFGGQEDAVLRLLTASKPLSLHEMGFSPHNQAKFKEMLTKPYGIILCVGPTGSGKTTTLHSALAIINSSERKIWTVEDPVEIVQKGLRQVQVNTKIGLTFTEALRSFLRADPDIIMIGEMRDTETAKTAVAASLTGHLVFSTLHTNSAPETAIRLIEMGMEPYNFSDALLGILAQRLARRLCLDCRVSYHPTRDEYKELIHQYGPDWFKGHGLPTYGESLHLMKKTGCETCGGTGYKGRIAIHELLVGTPAIKEAIKKNATVEFIRNLALQEGMRTLKMDGIQKVFQGITDLDQIMKVSIL